MALSVSRALKEVGIMNSTKDSNSTLSYQLDLACEFRMSLASVMGNYQKPYNFSMWCSEFCCSDRGDACCRDFHQMQDTLASVE